MLSLKIILMAIKLMGDYEKYLLYTNILQMPD
jgi:hypothetical protein